MDDIRYVDAGPRYSKAVIHNGTVYLAGQVAQDPSGSAADQTRQVLAQIDAMLAQCGTDKSRLLTAHILLADMRDFAAMNEVWDAWVVPGRPPTRTPMEGRMASQDYKVEIQVVAALAPGAAP